MSVFKLNDDQTSRFEAFLKHRRLNATAVSMLKFAVDEQKKKITSSKKGTASSLSIKSTMTYSAIATAIVGAINEGLITTEDVINMLEEAEYSGKQHVCIFKIPEKEGKKILNTLRKPNGKLGTKPQITDFITLPRESTAQVVVDTPVQVAVKIVTRRSYWTTNLLEDEDDHKVYEKNRHEERSAIIIKADLASNMLQIRVPPREHGPQETTRSVYDFITQSLESHFDIGKGSWFRTIEAIPIGDAFPAIVRNRDDFQMSHDTPENNKTRSLIALKGRPVPGRDLRDEVNWDHQKGYSRTNLRGLWQCPAQKFLYIHINADVVGLSATIKRKLARLFIPDLCSDGDVDYVVQRILEHI